MKTIEERAKAYEEILGFGYRERMSQFPSDAFIAGAQSEHEELTRWHDPIDHPEEGVEVLCKYKSCSGRLHYITAWYSKFHKGYMNDGYIRPILGWREIHK